MAPLSKVMELQNHGPTYTLAKKSVAIFLDKVCKPNDTNRIQ